MSSAEDLYAASGEAQPDVDMAGGEELVVGIGSRPDLGADNDLLNPEAIEDAPGRVTYVDYLKSPVIGLLVGQGDEQALLTAHQALLVKSPWFADACAKFSNDVSVGGVWYSGFRSLLGGVGWRFWNWNWNQIEE
jgi:hypothetical protein